MAGYGKIGAKEMDVGTTAFALRRLLMTLNEATLFSISFNVIVRNVSY